MRPMGLMSEVCSRDKPKSSSFACMPRCCSSITLLPFKSPWSTAGSWACMKRSALLTSKSTLHLAASLSNAGDSRRTACSSVGPSTTSETRARYPSSGSISAPWNRTMLGCLRRRSMRSSLVKLGRAFTDKARDEDEDAFATCLGAFTATCVPCSSAKRTSPKLPQPICCRVCGNSSSSQSSSQCSAQPNLQTCSSLLWTVSSSRPSGELIRARSAKMRSVRPVRSVKAVELVKAKELWEVKSLI
mmetsp:Transcript_43822/g.79232  ORF Transcript_43822/g.79232 Transcript_43822/m.79232 type:complete len:245 (-) Transcript_43822:406-1140(-)